MKLVFNHIYSGSFKKSVFINKIFLQSEGENTMQ